MPLPTAALTLGAFFASGFAALLYQVIWQRLLSVFSGADVYSATVIVAAFMAGLGLGNLTGGRVADRSSRRRCLLLFAGAEAVVGVFGALSGWLYYDVLYARWGALALGPAATGLVLFLSLLVPTCCMGASLPLLARAVTADVTRAALTIGTLYGLNTLGAACGALVGTWVLMPTLGLEGGLRVAAFLNVACALVVLPMAAVLPRNVQHHTPDVRTDTVRTDIVGADTLRADTVRADTVRADTVVSQPAVWPWMAVYALAGFVALSYEILWFRVLGVVVKSSAFTFGTLLAVYLTGIGLGAALGARRANRTTNPARAFFALQAAAGTVACLLVIALVVGADRVRFLAGYLAQYEPLDVRAGVQDLLAWRVPANFLRLYVGLPLLLVLPPTLLMGASFPFVQRAVQVDERRVGRQVAAVVSANILGSIVGTVVTGGILLTALGSAGTLRALAVVNVLFVGMALRGRGAALVTGGVVLALALAVLTPASEQWWARLHGTTPDRAVVAEDNTGVSVIRQGAERGTATVFVNGMGQSTLPYGGIHTALGLLPVLVHAAPRDVVIVGLGSGDTCYAGASRAETRRVTCVEIIGSQVATLRAWSRRDAYGGLRGLLEDPRIEHIVGDGRAYLLRTARRFDVIEADALRPTSAYSGNLYSDGYFALVRDRLRPGGVATTWAPTRRVHDGFVKVFPHVVSLPGLLIGSRDPIAVDRAEILARAASASVGVHLARAGVDLAALLEQFLPATIAQLGPSDDRSSLADVNTDLFPRDEFDLTSREKHGP